MSRGVNTSFIEDIKNLFKKNKSNIPAPDTFRRPSIRAQNTITTSSDKDTAKSTQPVQIEAIMQDRIEPVLRRIDSLEARITEQNNEIARLKSALSAAQQERDDLKKSLSSVEEKILDMLSLYEVVTDRINPFSAQKQDCSETSLNAPVAPVAQTKVENPIRPDPDISTHSTSATPLADKPVKPEGGGVPKQMSSARLVDVGADATTTIILLKWLEYLLEQTGKENLTRVLEYYVNTGWITNEILSIMKTYADAINVPPRQGKVTAELSVQDHIKSLLYIEKLRGNSVDKQMVSTIESELSVFQKCADVQV